MFFLIDLYIAILYKSFYASLWINIYRVSVFTLFEINILKNEALHIRVFYKFYNVR